MKETAKNYYNDILKIFNVKCKAIYLNSPKRPPVISL